MESPWLKATAPRRSSVRPGRGHAAAQAALGRWVACLILVLALPQLVLGQAAIPSLPENGLPQLPSLQLPLPELPRAETPQPDATEPDASLPDAPLPESPPSPEPPSPVQLDPEPLGSGPPGLPTEPSAASPTHHIPLQQPTGAPIVMENTPRGISLVARDASLADLLASLARSHDLNLVLTTPVDQRVTVSLRDRTLQQTLNSVLAAGGLTWAIRDDVIYISGAHGGSQSPHVQGRRLAVFELDYTSAPEVEQAISGLLSPAGKSWVSLSSSVDNRRTKEVVTVEDLPPYLERIEEYVMQLDQPPRQVLIEAHVLQIELDDDNRHGVNFKHIAKLGSLQIDFETVGLAETTPQAFFLRTNGPNITGLLEALKTTTDAKTLASPRIVALNGQESRIQVGEQLGFRVTTTTETSTLESVEFLDVGVVLTVTPRISRDGLVLMRIRPEVSRGSVDPQTGLPEEETTEVETDVLLPSGSGIVIGGLIQETDEVLTTKYLGLGDVPYIGPLFKRRAEIKNRQEIVIAIVPHVLPMPCAEQARNDFDLQRARTPLFDGPLIRHPRPYEPRLPDRRLPREQEIPSDCPVPGPVPGRYVPGRYVPGRYVPGRYVPGSVVPQGYGPQGYGPQGYTPEGYGPEGYAPGQADFMAPPEILPPEQRLPAPQGAPEDVWTPTGGRSEEYVPASAMLRRLPTVDDPATLRR